MSVFERRDWSWEKGQNGYLYYLMKIILTAVWLLWLKKFLIDTDAPYDHTSRSCNLKVAPQIIY